MKAKSNLNLADWSSIAEIVAAIGVMLSLIFVGYQIQDGNRETAAATIQAALDSEMSFQAEIARHTDTWSKVSDGGALSEGEEMRRAIALYGMLMTLYENRFHQFNSGYLDTPPTENLALLVSWPKYEHWRVRGGAATRTPEFPELLDKLRASGAD